MGEWLSDGLMILSCIQQFSEETPQGWLCVPHRKGDSTLSNSIFNPPDTLFSISLDFLWLGNL